MKKLTPFIFAIAMVFSIAFVSGAISSDKSFSAQGQTMTSSRPRKGIARRTYSGGKYVARKTYQGGKWVTKKTWSGTKWTARKTYRGGRKVVSRTKKVIY